MTAREGKAVEREADRPAALNINVCSAIVFQKGAAPQPMRLDDRDYLYGTPAAPRRQLIDNACHKNVCV